MWQSFGHFNADTNAATLAEMARVLRPEGRLLLDLYHRDFHAARLGERTIERDGARVHEHRSMVNGRLRAALTYVDGSGDVFDWQLYVPDELAKLAVRTGLTLRLACAEFDEATAASRAHARMQLVFCAARASDGRFDGDSYISPGPASPDARSKLRANGIKRTTSAVSSESSGSSLDAVS